VFIELLEFLIERWVKAPFFFVFIAQAVAKAVNGDELIFAEADPSYGKSILMYSMVLFSPRATQKSFVIELAIPELPNSNVWIDPEILSSLKKASTTCVC